MSETAADPAPAHSATPRPNGRPRKFTDLEQLETAIDAYFADCDTREKPYTMAGLARALQCSTMTLRCYEEPGRRPEAMHWSPGLHFSAAVKAARHRVEQWTEERLHEKGIHPAGPIFSLKNNFGWKDTQEIQVTQRSISIGVLLTEEQRSIIAEQLLQTVSPVLDHASTLSPALETTVSEAQGEAKATPIA